MEVENQILMSILEKYSYTDLEKTLGETVRILLQHVAVV